MIQKERLSVLIPYRDREDNLKVFTTYFHNFMKNNHPNIMYDIIIIEQGNKKPFNKGILFNIGFLLSGSNIDYFALHDVDQLPISANYTYAKRPAHICVNVFSQNSNGQLHNTYKHEKYQQRGGAIIINRECYTNANGHSNNFWGWGGIDDDFSNRNNFCGNGFHRFKNIEENDNGYFVSLCANTKRFTQDEHYTRNYDYAKKVLYGEIDWKTEGLNTTIYFKH